MHLIHLHVISLQNFKISFLAAMIIHCRTIFAVLVSMYESFDKVCTISDGALLRSQ